MKQETKMTDAEYRKRARDLYADDDIAIDDDAVISRGDEPGAYVQAWVWVPDEDETDPVCPTCGSTDDVSAEPVDSRGTYECIACRVYFTPEA